MDQQDLGFIFSYLFAQVMVFLRYPFTLFGFTFSLMQVWFYSAFFALLINFIWQLFGRENVHEE